MRIKGPEQVAVSWQKVVPVIVLTTGGLALFALQLPFIGYPLVAVGVILGFWWHRPLGKDLLAVALGVAVMGLVPITTDISWSHMVVMGIAMIAALLIPFYVSRKLDGYSVITYPLRSGWPWPAPAWWYLIIVLIVGYFLLPVYLITSGVYQNWPAVHSQGEVARLFIGTNALGIWDELFFICTVYALYRRHFPAWLANLFQAVLFTSFLYELGFRSWGPLIVFPFALVQGFTFTLTKSLGYVITVHLLFDFILFLVLVHAHQRDWFAIFLY